MKIKTIKFANAVKLGQNAITSIVENGRQQKTNIDIELVQGVHIKLTHTASGEQKYTSLFNTVEFEEKNDTSVEQTQGPERASKKKSK